MVRLGETFGLALAATLLCCAGPGLQVMAQTPVATSPAAGSTAKPSSGHSRHKKAAEQAAIPQTPPPPPTLEQTPPTPPRVTYQNGLLTIDAQNSTLSQVLRSVQLQTGASIDMPAGASDRVVTHLGPGQPRDVLNTLLNGSKFDYIILGMTNDPGGVQKVILTPRQNAGQPVNTAQNNVSQPPHQGPGGEEEQVPVEEEVQPNNEDQAQYENQQVQPPGRFRPLPGQQPENSENSFGTESPQPGAKTPEQLLQELQRMQQQQQIYQQQLNPANQEPQQQQQQ